MTVTPREIEKLKALGYQSVGLKGEGVYLSPQWYFVPEPGIDAWQRAREHARTDLKLTMADKVAWLCENVGPLVLEMIPGVGWYICHEDSDALFGKADSPAAAVDDLFWKAP